MKMHGIARHALVFLVLVMTGMLLAGPAGAQDVDAKGEKELTTVGQKIDKTAAGADGGRVTSRIVDEWKGTKFQFDDPARHQAAVRTGRRLVDLLADRR